MIEPGGSAPERERDESVAKHHSSMEIASHDDALPFDAVLTGAQEICRQERRYQPRDQQRECDRDGDRETELPEILPAMPPMKLTGTNMATMVMVVATTASPISSAAWSEAIG